MPVPENFSIGSVVGGKFRILAPLGRGAMGWVFEAEHIELGHAVAVKIIDPEGVDLDALKRFKREGLALAKLESEHVVRVIDYGSTAKGAPYLVMERLKGRDVAAHLKEQGRLTVGEAAEIVYQAAEALAEAHLQGVVHRDLKPSNLFLAEKPNGKRVTKVLDFGVSLLREQGEDALTSNKMMLGTPFYMSPEQLLSSHDVTGQSDIWALGVILFQLVSGKRPFPAKTILELATMLKSDAPSLLTQSPDAPREFAAVVGRCLARVPSERFADAEGLRSALDPFREQHILTGTIRSASVEVLAVDDAPALDAPATEPDIKAATPAASSSALTTSTAPLPTFSSAGIADPFHALPPVPGPTAQQLRAPSAKAQGDRSHGFFIAIALAAATIALVGSYFLLRPSRIQKPEVQHTMQQREALAPTPVPTGKDLAPRSDATLAPSDAPLDESLPLDPRALKVPPPKPKSATTAATAKVPRSLPNSRF